MRYEKEFIYIKQYEYTGTNQHGDRYKRNGSKQRSVVKIIARLGNPQELTSLILLGHSLDVPVRYDFNSQPQEAYIKVLAFENMNKIIG